MRDVCIYVFKFLTMQSNKCTFNLECIFHAYVTLAFSGVFTDDAFIDRCAHKWCTCG